MLRGIDETSALNREIRELEDQIDLESKKKTVKNLEKIKEDLQKIKSERKANEKAMKQGAKSNKEGAAIKSEQQPESTPRTGSEIRADEKRFVDPLPSWHLEKTYHVHNWSKLVSSALLWCSLLSSFYSSI